MHAKVFLILSALAFVILTACSGSDAELGRISLASSLDDNGIPSESSETFAPGDTIYLAVEFTSGYKGLEATVNWYREQELLSTQAIALPRDVDSLDRLWVTEALQTEPDWPEGTYQCELFVPDQGTFPLSFQLEKTKNP
jgi:hypothetical protein